MKHAHPLALLGAAAALFAAPALSSAQVFEDNFDNFVTMGVGDLSSPSSVGGDPWSEIFGGGATDAYTSTAAYRGNGVAYNGVEDSAMGYFPTGFTSNGFTFACSVNWSNIAGGGGFGTNLKEAFAFYLGNAAGPVLTLAPGKNVTTEVFAYTFRTTAGALNAGTISGVTPATTFRIVGQVIPPTAAATANGTLRLWIEPASDTATPLVNNVTFSGGGSAFPADANRNPTLVAFGAPVFAGSAARPNMVIDEIQLFDGATYDGSGADTYSIAYDWIVNGFPSRVSDWQLHD
ncbi:MAG: hypothetical protein SF028_09390 [Candidatus Sumerlaeia bacterium]|nr:hypothetical protein [Candidatus Sumerlaeia bacterium]